MTETRPIPFATRRVNDPTLAEGTEKVKRRGVAGLKRLVYRVVLTGGVETDREQIRETVVRAPVTRLIAVGTKPAEPASRCDPNYAGACVPIADDVDCEGGSGNGPEYVDGPVRVVGDDVYDLDRDGDGTACDT